MTRIWKNRMNAELVKSVERSLRDVRDLFRQPEGTVKSDNDKKIAFVALYRFGLVFRMELLIINKAPNLMIALNEEFSKAPDDIDGALKYSIRVMEEFLKMAQQVNSVMDN